MLESIQAHIVQESPTNQSEFSLLFFVLLHDIVVGAARLTNTWAKLLIVLYLM